MSREAKINRTTKETDINLSLTVDGQGRASINTGVGFLDHMLTLLTVHGFFDLDIDAAGDLDVDAHHTTEDLGICLGKALTQALGDLSGIRRFGNASIPMEETLACVNLDICSRPYLVYKVEFLTSKVGNFDTELVEVFLRALAANSGMTLHVQVPYGKNSHHIAEAIFKALGRAIDKATQLDPRLRGPLSSKGALYF
ncbi:MAG: imidazoleglycerol-phosphate dehydratase HisB [Deltaproteobacteria bacterium]|nr:imidazoleglycerol-phosphate dehydratase HisB [Deltaproteobacteria bacterium]MBW1966207.1 imidazoleglycerol-phosphate dehydratase HisB [Deltaproteobacteria bacterium]MBW2097246.1 imidazoleglycerol-phosphate dehydratase HisB [Deltaproteobacteria bacterium]PXF53199.1 MAG: imidazoleglycerol-phosphate dehydratase HisB [Deltaproteobacteria bacterium]RKX60621.1 MAG: imidazoleglycerol-phosphate dehydratase HisB [Thermodesulfobacteriota bacterium]